jgi:hypothetical protein
VVDLEAKGVEFDKDDDDESFIVILTPDVINLFTEPIVMALGRYPETIFESLEGSDSNSEKGGIEEAINTTGKTSTQPTGMESYREDCKSSGYDKRTNNAENSNFPVVGLGNSGDREGRIAGKTNKRGIQSDTRNEG